MREAFRRSFPWILLAALAVALALAGPIRLPDGYHHFADTRNLLGLPNAIDVLSNLGFLFAGLFGLAVVRRSPASPTRPWWGVFSLAVVAVSLGSTWYHLAPDDVRLVWDRFPIALACAAVLAAVVGERLGLSAVRMHALGAALALAALGSVLAIPVIGGDLRPYLLLQLAVLVGIPALNWATRAPRLEQVCFAAASLCYLLAKLTEGADAPLFAATGGWIGGHAVKHLLSTLACAAVVVVLGQRAPAAQPGRVSLLRIAKVSFFVLGCGMLAVVLHEGRTL